MKKVRLSQILGIIGTVGCLILFVRSPSFPTPDKLLVFLTFVFMMFGRATQLLKRLVPFVGLLLIYESFRGLVPHLNHRVNYAWMPSADRFIFRCLPTQKLQSWLWHGQTRWYDIALYLPYVLHFVMPLILVLLIWRYHDKHYWKVVTAYLSTSFAAFVTFLAFPAAPPWMASDAGVIPHITRISSNVWFSLGLHDFPSVYNKISPNPVAAVPSLHAAYATLFALYITKLFKSRWRFMAWVFPVLIYLGTIYEAEHYAIDAILGSAYALTIYLALEKLWPHLPAFKNLSLKWIKKLRTL